MLPTESTLEYALIGLLRDRPMSGYDVRKMFGATPLAYFSQSPGAIYPALNRLERRGWIAGSIERKNLLRPRKVYRPTARGLAHLRTWLLAPVTESDIIWRLDMLMLKFSLMSPTLNTRDVVGFLEQVGVQLAAYIPTLRDYY